MRETPTFECGEELVVPGRDRGRRQEVPLDIALTTAPLFLISACTAALKKQKDENRDPFCDR